MAPRVKISSLADHRPRRLNQRHLHLEGAGAEPYRPALGQDLQTDERHHRGRGRRGNHGRLSSSIFLKKITDFRIRPRIRGRIVLSVRPTWPPAGAPQAAAEAEPTSEVYDGRSA